MVRKGVTRVGVHLARAYSDQAKTTTQGTWKFFVENTPSIGLLFSIFGGFSIVVYTVGSAQWRSFSTQEKVESQKKLAETERIALEEKIESQKKLAETERIVLEEKFESQKKLAEKERVALEEKIKALETKLETERKLQEEKLESERRVSRERERAIEEKAEKTATMNYLKFAHSEEYSSLRKKTE